MEIVIGREMENDFKFISGFLGGGNLSKVFKDWFILFFNFNFSLSTVF